MLLSGATIYDPVIISASIYFQTWAGIDGQGRDSQHGVFGTAIRKVGMIPIIIALKISVRVMLIIYLISGLIMISLVATNAFHKLNKMNVIETDAIVLGGDWESIRSSQGGSYTTHELLLLYSDDKSETYITKKAVTGPTYRAYSRGDTITLFYRNNNVYDTFVQAESMKEIFPAFINFFTFIIGAYLVSLYSFYRNWRKKRQNKHNQQEVEGIHNL